MTTTNLIRHNSTSPQNDLPILTFTLDNQTYALLVEDVVEVAVMVERMAMPDAPPEGVGVVNRHGVPLPLLDLRLVFKHRANPITSATLFIVVAQAGEQIGLVVDEVYQVEYADSKQFNSTATSGKYIRGIISLRAQLIPVIALASLFETYFARHKKETFEG